MRILPILLLACQNAPAPETIDETPKHIEAAITPHSDADVSYVLDFSERAAQYFEVRALFPTHGQDTLELALATWTPGSYFIRDYSKHVEHFKAQNVQGESLEVVKTRKNRWAIEATDLKNIQISYKVYAHAMTVRGNWVEQNLAVLNGAPTFIFDAKNPDQTASITVHDSEAWANIHTALRNVMPRFTPLI